MVTGETSIDSCIFFTTRAEMRGGGGSFVAEDEEFMLMILMEKSDLNVGKQILITLQLNSSTCTLYLYYEYQLLQWSWQRTTHYLILDGHYQVLLRY